MSNVLVKNASLYLEKKNLRFAFLAISHPPEQNSETAPVYNYHIRKTITKQFIDIFTLLCWIG